MRADEKQQTEKTGATSRPAASRTAASFPPVAWYWSFVIAVLALDIVSKWIVTHTMDLYQSIPLVGGVLQLTYVRNTGAAFSLLAEFNSPWRLALFITVNSTAAVVFTWLAHHEKGQGPRLLIPFGLVSAGAVGNLLDRISTGTVVDFIDVGYGAYHFPVFNFADSAVCVGVSLLILLSFRQQSKQPQTG